MFRIGVQYFFSAIQRSRLRNALYLSITSIGFNIGILIVGVALIRGFESSALKKLLHITGHGYMKPFQDLPELMQHQSEPAKSNRLASFCETVGISRKVEPKLIHVMPSLETRATLLDFKSREGLLVRGIRDKDLKHLFSDKIVHGESKIGPSGNVQQIIVGYRLAELFNLNVGDKVHLLLESGEFETEISAIFNFDFADFDSSLVFISSSFLREEIGLKPMAGLIYIEEPDKIDEFITSLKYIYPNIKVESWHKRNKALKDMFDSQIRAVYVLIGLYILSGIIQSISSLYILFSERLSDISILTLLGMSAWQRCKIFIAYGLLVSLANTMLGLIFGMLLTNVYPQIRNVYKIITGTNLIHKDMFWISEFDPKLLPNDLLTIIAAAFAAMVLCMFVASYFISNKEIIRGVKE